MNVNFSVEPSTATDGHMISVDEFDAILGFITWMLELPVGQSVVLQCAKIGDETQPAFCITKR